MLFKDQKREKQELKAKPGIWDLAKEIAGTIDPYDEEPDVNKLFERLVCGLARELQLIEEQVNTDELMRRIIVGLGADLKLLVNTLEPAPAQQVVNEQIPELSNLPAEDQEPNVQDMLGIS